MESRRIKPDVYSYNIVIGGFAKLWKTDKAQFWFDEMQRQGVAPDIVSYGTLINSYLNEKNIEKKKKNIKFDLFH